MLFLDIPVMFGDITSDLYMVIRTCVLNDWAMFGVRNTNWFRQRSNINKIKQLKTCFAFHKVNIALDL